MINETNEENLAEPFAVRFDEHVVDRIVGATNGEPRTLPEERSSSKSNIRRKPRALKQLSITDDKYPEVIVGLEHLYQLSVGGLLIRSLGVRTKLNEILSPLYKHSHALQTALKASQTDFFKEAFHLAAAHDYLINKAKRQEQPLAQRTSYDVEETVSSVPPFENPLPLMDQIAALLDPLSSALSSFARLAEKFDALSPDERFSWLSERSTSDYVPQIRAKLTAFLAKDSSAEPERAIIRCISSLYEFAFNERFAIKPRHGKTSFNDHKRLCPDVPVRQFEGPGLRFACATVRELKLQGFFISYKGDELGYSTRVDREEPPPTTFDRRKYKRSHALYSESLPHLYPELENRIGSLWQEEREQRETIA